MTNHLKRHKVLESWNKYKQKALEFKKVIKLLSEQTDKTVLPSFPLGLNQCRDKLDSWTNYQFSNKIQPEKASLSKIQELSEDECLFNLTFFYYNALDMFKDLTQGWKKEKDSYANYKSNNSNSGPTIHDDW